MSNYTRRHFLKDGSAALAGTCLGLPVIILNGCSDSSTDAISEHEPPDDSGQNEPVGHWEIVDPVPVSSWSAALLPTGKVLLFQNGEQMYLWDPDTRQFGNRTPASSDLFCAGLAMLADGRLLAAGGHEDEDEDHDHFLGLKSAEIYDPWQEQWSKLPDMEGGERWYPTAVTLSDGRVLVASGTHAGVNNETIEIFDPAADEWTIVAGHALPLYPWAACRPDGELVFYGPMAQSLHFS